MRPPEPHATRPATPAGRSRALGPALALAMLGIALLMPAGAPARATVAHHRSCPSAAKHAKRTVRASHCTKHTVHRSKQLAHQPAAHGKPVNKSPHKSTGGPAQTPALCEDASAPVRTHDGFACQDGSEPSCEDASEPLVPPGGGAPACQTAASTGEATGESCPTEGGGECQTAEWSCEDSFDKSEASLACEPSGGGEASS